MKMKMRMRARAVRIEQPDDYSSQCRAVSINRTSDYCLCCCCCCRSHDDVFCPTNKKEKQKKNTSRGIEFIEFLFFFCCPPPLYIFFFSSFPLKDSRGFFFSPASCGHFCGIEPDGHFPVCNLWVFGTWRTEMKVHKFHFYFLCPFI